MMRAKFKHPRTIDGVHFKVGEHDIPEKFQKHWFFLALQRNHDVMVIEHKEEPKTLPPLEEPKEPVSSTATKSSSVESTLGDPASSEQEEKVPTQPTTRRKKR